MKYQILGKNIEVTDGIRSSIEKKLARMDKYFVINDDVTCRVVVRSYKVGSKIEVTIFKPFSQYSSCHILLILFQKLKNNCHNNNQYNCY